MTVLTNPPSLVLPSAITVSATSAAGAAVDYTASATDMFEGDLPVGCTPPAGATFPVGTTTVNCTATDAFGKTSSGTFTVQVKVTTPPVLTLSGTIVASATGPGGGAVTFTPTAKDLLGVNVPVTCTPPSGSTFPLGDTTVNCTATDSYGNVGTGSFTVKMQNSGNPVLVLPGNIVAPATGPTGAVVTFTASASDIVDGAVPVVCTPPSGSTFPVASTVVTCTATNHAAHTASGTFTVTVKDVPVLTLPAGIAATAKGPDGTKVNFQAKASDPVTGRNIPVTCTPSSGSTFPIATTTVNCTATNPAGNTVTGSFGVTVRDVPKLRLPAHRETTATGPGGAVVTFNATVVDRGDPSASVLCSPASGSMFPVGATTVTCTATNRFGGTATDTLTVTVKAPKPKLQVRDRITVTATGPTGAIVTYVANATDVVDGTIAAVCTPASGSMFSVGNTTVRCTVTNSAGGTDTGRFTVTVVKQPRP